MLGRKVDMVLLHAQGAEGQEREQTQSTDCKATDEDEIITYPATNEEIARKKPLVYYNGAAKEGKTDCIMHEYRLAGSNAKLDLAGLEADTTSHKRVCIYMQFIFATCHSHQF